MALRTLTGRALVGGTAGGPLLFSDVGISFMGGVDLEGVVVDKHHPLLGRCVAGAVLAIPSGRGSCAGSLALFELLTNGHAPAALVFEHLETILTVGDFIGIEMFGLGIPIVQLEPDAYASLAGGAHARVEDGAVTIADQPLPAVEHRAWLPPLDLDGFELTDTDRSMLAGERGEAERAAMAIAIRTAQLEGGTDLVDVEQAHIDGDYFQGPASLVFARRLRDLGGRVRVPATMNATCVDLERWRAQGVDGSVGVPSQDIADAYLDMGVSPSFTCAPYLLRTAPHFGQQIAWGESNAVAFANSALGARTLKYPDLLDILVAVTGRGPNVSTHRPVGRLATLRVDVPRPRDPDDAYFALLGYHVGKLSPVDIPLVCGLEQTPVSRDDIKAFSAAFATTSSAPMFHILGVTPEAGSVAAAAGPTGPRRQATVSAGDLRATWDELNTATSPEIDLVSIGNPHASLTEIGALATACSGRTKADGVAVMVTCGREVYGQAVEAGYAATIRAFGGDLITDTCWCLIREPVIPVGTRNIGTNSGKYAHYGPAALPNGFHFASLARLVDGACTGRVDTAPPAWVGD